MMQSNIEQGIMNAEGLRERLILKNTEEILPLGLIGHRIGKKTS